MVVVGGRVVSGTVGGVAVVVDVSVELVAAVVTVVVSLVTTVVVVVSEPSSPPHAVANSNTVVVSKMVRRAFIETSVFNIVRGSDIGKSGDLVEDSRTNADSQQDEQTCPVGSYALSPTGGLTAKKQILEDAHAVFLPAIDEQSVPTHIAEHLGVGGTSVLVGESREEYVARRMSAGRRSRETAEWFEQFTSAVRSAAGGRALIAVDQEVGGIQRMHRLVSPLPATEEFVEMTEEEIEAIGSRLAHECSSLGVNVFLAPVVDIVTGSNPWLAGRTVSSDPQVMGRTMSAFVGGVQSSGKVAATAKHFPGHPNIPLDPAVHNDAQVEADQSEIDPTIGVFKKVVSAGVRVVMTGPALVPAMDAEYAASTSTTMVDYLRNEVGFGGVILSDDLDAPGILRGGSVAEAAIRSLSAGVDWLLVAGTAQLPNLVGAVAHAADNGGLSPARLHEAAEAVRHLTMSLE